MSKPITAAAVMVLVDEGKLTIGDAVEKHLPEFRGQMVAVWQDGGRRGPLLPDAARRRRAGRPRAAAAFGRKE